MPICFVIQPFDSGKFDKRFDDVFKPAIESAGLEAYRVDRDPTVEIPIEAIEEGIRSAAICLADITSDNPNVWYELGYAYATGRAVIMVCSEERKEKKYPFDIQHRSIIMYKSEAPSDFDGLGGAITDKLLALLNKMALIRQIQESEQVAPQQGLSQAELLVLASLAGEIGPLGGSYSLYSLKRDSERSGLTAIGFTLAFRRLVSKYLIVIVEVEDENGYPYEECRLTDIGWNWIETNESLFVLLRQHPQAVEIEDPF